MKRIIRMMERERVIHLKMKGLMMKEMQIGIKITKISLKFQKRSR